MTPREKIIALARECDAGFTCEDEDPMGDSLIGWEAVEAFYHAVRNEALEDAAVIASKHTDASYLGKVSYEIRQMKEGKPRCQLCNYQHGHQIGCADNPIDMAIHQMKEETK